MIELLKGHGVTFSHEEEALAENVLSYVNYYRLSVFILYLSDNRSFSSLLKLYDFDEFLRISINRLIPSIEIFLKTNLSYFLANHRDELTEDRTLPSGLIYLDKTIYKERHIKNSDVDRWYSKVSEELFKKTRKRCHDKTPCRVL